MPILAAVVAGAGPVDQDGEVAEAAEYGIPILVWSDVEQVHCEVAGVDGVLLFSLFYCLGQGSSPLGVLTASGLLGLTRTYPTPARA
jgi:hypothetical protein